MSPSNGGAAAVALELSQALLTAQHPLLPAGLPWGSQSVGDGTSRTVPSPPLPAAGGGRSPSLPVG